MRLSVHDEHKNFVVTSERTSILRSYSNLSTSRLPPIDLNFRQCDFFKAGSNQVTFESRGKVVVVVVVFA